MDRELSNTDMRAAAAPKSDQINADDLIGATRDVTIRGVRQYDRREQKTEIDLVEVSGKCWRPCLSMVRVMMAAWSIDGSTWIGRRVRLFRDPRAEWAGEAVGGIRISHMSHIPSAMAIPITEKKGKRSIWTVQPLPMNQLDDVIASLGLSEAEVDVWLGSKGKPAIATLSDTERARFAGFLAGAKPEIIDTIRSGRQPGEEA